MENIIPNAFYRVSAKALIYNEKGEFLLCREKTGLWDFPGGGLDHGEDLFECIIRELREEMGLKVINIIKTPKIFATAHKPESKTRPWIGNICFEVEVEDLNFVTSDECEEIGFFTPETVKNIKVLPNVTEVVKYM